MKRLLSAALLAMLLHGALLWWGPHWRGTQAAATSKSLPPIRVELALTPAALTPPAPMPAKLQPEAELQPQPPLPTISSPQIRQRPLEPEPEPPPALPLPVPPPPTDHEPTPLYEGKPGSEPPPAAPTTIPLQPAAAELAESTAEAPLPPASALQPSAAKPSAPTPAAVVESPDSTRLLEAYPLYRLNPPPPYPPASRQRNEQGTVLLAVLVGADGRVVAAEIAESSGHPRLDRAALRAVGEWLFEPGRRGREKIAMQVMVPIRFDLR